jgi:hypothetical protein
MEQYKYKVYKIKGQKFIVKQELNPLTNTYEFHMYLRHLVMPEQAIAAYYSKTTDFYNSRYDRNELYSEELNITVYYKNLAPDILLITAFYKGESYGR